MSRAQEPPGQSPRSSSFSDRTVVNALMDSRTQEICWALLRESRELIEWCREHGIDTPKDKQGKDMTDRVERACRDLTRKL